MKLHERERSPSFPFSFFFMSRVSTLFFLVVLGELASRLFIFDVFLHSALMCFVMSYSKPWLARLAGNWEKPRRLHILRYLCGCMFYIMYVSSSCTPS